MEVIDRYLQAVSSWLPKGQRADIVSELSEDLRSEVEEREQALGRALDEAELAALLERRGHPMWVAEGYLPQRHLIGRALLPAYFRTLKIAAAGLAAVVVTLYLVFSGPARGAAPALSSPGLWLWVLGIASLTYLGLFTLIFALLERRHHRARRTGTWDPRDPAGLPHAPVDPIAAARRSTRGYAIVDVAGDAAILAMWLGFRASAVPGLGLVVTPVWSAMHWPVAAFLAASIALAVADAVSPVESRRRLLLRLGVDAFALLLAGMLLGAWPWVQITGPGVPADKAALLAKWLNVSALVTLLAIAGACTVRVVRLERRVGRREAGLAESGA